MICSKTKLQHELENISSILRNNGYPESIIQITMSKKIVLFDRKPKEEPQKCPIYLKLPWIGNISLNFEKQTKIAINQCYQAVEPRIIFTTRKILPAIHKDVLPSLQQSMVVYQYVCRCDCRYVGQTSQRLQDRINQHIPRCIRSDKRPTKNLPNRECKITSPLVSTVILQSDSIYWRIKNVPNISTMPNFPFWPQQDLHSIYQFWKQPTSIPYSLFSVVKRNSFITPNFTLIFFLTFPTKPKQYFSTNQIARMTNFDQSENDKKFSIFSILLH